MWSWHCCGVCTIFHILLTKKLDRIQGDCLWSITQLSSKVNISTKICQTANSKFSPLFCQELKQGGQVNTCNKIFKVVGQKYTHCKVMAGGGNGNPLQYSCL